MPILIPEDIKLKKDIQLTDNGDVSNCTHPAGHCFGSDGGSGIPESMKVLKGRGGEQRIWDVDIDDKIKEDAWYERCQYCLKYHFVETNEERKKDEEIDKE